MENYQIIDIGKAKDLTGQHFGRLVAKNRVKKLNSTTKGTFWLCECECGNEVIVSYTHLQDGHSKSCGCLKQEPLIDITGQRFGKLIVLGYDHTEGKGKTYWKCKCDCGIEKIIRKDGLISGNIVSCGCYKAKRTSERFSANLIGQRFGKLVVKERYGSNKFNQTLWLCQCDCGNTHIVDTHSLTSGQSNSCGCLTMSSGELKIIQLLKNNNIFFEQQKTFPTCKINNLLRFDFYLPQQNVLIEFDGKQHYIPSKYNNSWNTLEKVQKTQEYDKYKNNWCKNNNIPLIRIPYWHLQNLCIEDLLLETTKFLVKEK